MNLKRDRQDIPLGIKRGNMIAQGINIMVGIEIEKFDRDLVHRIDRDLMTRIKHQIDLEKLIKKNRNHIKKKYKTQKSYQKLRKMSGILRLY